MRWSIFLIAAVAALVWDTGLGAALRLEKLGDVRPSLCAVLAAFVALSAPRTTALWACFLLGLLLDLSNQLTTAGPRVVYLIGPYALGYAAGGWAVLQLKPMVFRRRPLTIGVLTAVCLLVVHGVALLVYALRGVSWYPGAVIYWTDQSALVELLRRFLIALYSGLLAVPVGWALVRSVPLWGFQSSAHRASTIR